jgi:hypothetical protein
MPLGCPDRYSTERASSAETLALHEKAEQPIFSWMAHKGIIKAASLPEFLQGPLSDERSAGTSRALLFDWEDVRNHISSSSAPFVMAVAIMCCWKPGSNYFYSVRYFIPLIAFSQALDQYLRVFRSIFPDPPKNVIDSSPGAICYYSSNLAKLTHQLLPGLLPRNFIW